MISSRQQIIELIEQGAIPVEKIPDALITTKVTPDRISWRNFIDHLLLWLGGMALASAAIFFIAYNWNGMGRFAKFGMMEMLIILAIAAYWKSGELKVSGKVSMLMASIFLGVLLALYGQTYQTGADSWQLFCNWALLMLPWAFIGRFPAIWIVWLILVNLSIVLYYRTFGGIFGLMFYHDTNMYWLMFILNTLALITWELFAKTWSWLEERWAVRLVALSSGITIIGLLLYAIFDREGSLAITGLVWAAWLIALYFVYRRIWPDLFMLAGCCLSMIIVVVAFLSKHLLNNNSAGGFLFLSLVVIAMGAGSALWLRNIHQEELS